MRKKQIICKRCESKNTYVLIDGTIVCRGCGYKNKKNKIPLEEDDSFGDETKIENDKEEMNEI